MNLEEKANEISKAIHKANTWAMTPVTLSHIAGILLYVAVAFQGLITPDGGFNFQFMAKVVICFAVIGGLNTYIFEIWTHQRLLVASRILAWDGDPESLSQKRAVESLIALLDFPHEFILRFILQWLIGAPLIILALRIFYAMPVSNTLYVILGVMAILCLMCTMHYFLIKSNFNEHLANALQKYPTYFERPELERRRISYGVKIFIYILILVGAMTWLTTHLNIIGRTRLFALQRDRFLDSKLKSNGEDLATTVANRPEAQVEIEAKVHNLLGGDSDIAYLLDKNLQKPLKERDLLGPQTEPPALEQAILSLIPQVSGEQPSIFSWEGIKRFFSVNQILLVKISDRVMQVYTGTDEYIVTVDPLAKYLNAGQPIAATLVTIRSESTIRFQTMAQSVAWVVMMFVALILSLLFARFMQRELMIPISQLITMSKRVASGNLSKISPIIADDELGELSVFYLRMVASLREAVKKVAAAAISIDRASSQIATRTREMAEGSQAQSTGVDQTSNSIEEMNSRIGDIAESVETLANSAQESSASILQMSTTNEHVASISEDLSMAVDQTTSSIQEMSASIKEVADIVKSTTGKAGDTASQMRQMRETLKKVDLIAAESAGVSEQVTKDAAVGSEAVQSTMKGIEKIQVTSERAAEVIERLSRRAREIGRILSVIEDVTEETNLLALNAAIIAAQAGEHGRGFAVVADEIKDLAERTQASTAVIAEQIQAVQDDARDAVSAVKRGGESVGEGVRLSEEAGEALRKILESASRSLSLARNISEATMQQNKQAEQVLVFFEAIASMIGQINTATQEQTRGSEQILLAAERMRDIAAQVRKATREQAIGGKQISQAIEHISHISTYINSSQSDQRRASVQVLTSMNTIAEIATRNVKGVEKVTQAVSNLQVIAEELKNMLMNFQLAMDENKEIEEDNSGSLDT